MYRRTLMAAALAGGLPCVGRAATHRVVLELFTSQGCSSCPPADALLGRLTKRPDVIALAWHVDYWAHLGWRDRFASRTATLRQQLYSRQLDSVVFTPALVVNGAKIVTGSESEAVDAAIRAADTLPVAVTLNRWDQLLSVDVAAGSGPMHVQRIVYDPEQATDVSAGENDGERLREYRVVREVETLSDQNGSAHRLTTRLPGPGQGQVILVQSADLRVLGAADLPPA